MSSILDTENIDLCEFWFAKLTESLGGFAENPEKAVYFIRDQEVIYFENQVKKYFIAT